MPIHHAAMKGHADIVQTLINAGAEVNPQEKVSLDKRPAPLPLDCGLPLRYERELHVLY